MKKLITLFAIVGMLAFQGCTGPEGPPGPPGEDGLIAEVFELKNINFTFSSTNGYTVYQKLTPNIFVSDVVLIYRLSGTIDSNTPIWQLIPRTLYLTQGELDYDFDFSKEDFTIFARGTYNIATTPQYINNQTFRIVILPGSFSASLNVSNYADVMSALNFKETQVQKINF
ncbi:hypothetical protein [Flavobacterium sp.]|jgi:hypothetical protein|uniref:hypothetical protein n=1 Tax=Flavobacterium sp. TaxID=239 RepID=UPI0037C0CB8F